MIRGAFDVLNQRMFNGQVAQNLNSLRDQWEVVVQDAAWQKSLSLPAEEQIAPVRDQLLMHQLDGLSALEVPVQIDHFNQDSDRWGEAYVGVVTCRRSAGGNVVLDGTFRLSLNAHFMGNRELWQGTDPKVWAVVIAHELLHNLGHMHNDRAALTQMIAFERCLYYDGNYTLDLVCPEYECGAKTLPPAT